MGILDSNKLFLKQKSGEFTLDLTTPTTGQNPINFNGVSYSGIKFVIVGIPQDADVTIGVWVSAGSNAVLSNIRDSSGNVIGSFVSKNGTYYADVSGCAALHFAVARALQSGTATVRWVLTPILNDISVSRNLDRIAERMASEVLGASETFALDTQRDLKTYSVDVQKYKCVCVDVSDITEGAIIKQRTSLYAPTPIFDTEGNISYNITKKGIYFVPINYPSSFTIRNEKAINGGSLTVRTYLLNEFPKHLLELKPVQLLASKVISINKSTSIVAFFDNEIPDIKLFKYYYICYQFKNNGHSVPRHMRLEAQPYNYIICNSRVLLESDTYSNQTDWQEVNAIQCLNVYITVDNYQEGDSVEIKVIGIR